MVEATAPTPQDDEAKRRQEKLERKKERHAARDALIAAHESREEEKNANKLACKEMGNLPHEEWSWIWIGGASDAGDDNLLRKHNVKYVLNCTHERTAGGVMNYFDKHPTLGIEYVRLAMNDNPTETLERSYEKAWEFLERVRIREHGTVLVHCQQGVSRSVSMIIAYMMKYHQWSLDDSLALCRQGRAVANPNEGFLEQLRKLEEELKATDGYAKVNRNEGLTRKRAVSDVAGGPAKKRAIGVSGPPIGVTKGPQRGPVGPAAGPARGPVGPARGPVGPAAGPSPLGPSAGPSMGPSMGPSVGPSVGPAAGPNVGPSVGPSVGPQVGPSVGPAIGPTTGS